MNTKRLFPLQHLIRNYAYCKPSIKPKQPKPVIVPSEEVLNEIADEAYKPRNHPGVVKLKNVILPKALVEAIGFVVEDYPVKPLLEEGDSLTRHLKHKHPPIEQNELRKSTREVKDKVVSKYEKFRIANPDDEYRYKATVEREVNKVLGETVYNWQPVNYNERTSLVHLLSRTAPEYAVLLKIFTEIKMRDPDFKPRSLFDFGSGVGTVMWAANEFWKKSIHEYFNVDSSVHMNDLAELLLKGGKGNRKMDLRGVYFRQFLPSTPVSYDLVVSSYTMLELPSRQTRLETLLNLWNRTHKYLVIVDHGTRAGFKIVNELRDYILSPKRQARSNGHVFAPCPHDELCPKFKMAENVIPCNFHIYYHALPFGRKNGVTRMREGYSYVVLKKGERDENDSQWPRLVADTIVRSKHSRCHLCTKNGNIEEVVFTASKHGKTMYHCARSSKWGDRLPIDIDRPKEEQLEMMPESEVVSEREVVPEHEMMPESKMVSEREVVPEPEIKEVDSK